MSLRTRTTLLLVVSFAVYIGVMLPLDLSSDVLRQSLLSLTTWAFLGIGLWMSRPEERTQVVTMVCVATFFEVIASLIWGLYRYRLDNLPLYVPPGHGLFYLMALRVSQLPLLEQHGKSVARAVLVGATLLAAVGLLGPLVGRHPDILGLVTWVALVPFLVFGRSRLMFAVSFTMTMALEIYGTSLGTWAWAPVMPLLGLAAGNPPACIGAGYCWMDRIARHLAPHVDAAARRFAERAAVLVSLRRPEPAPD